MFTNKSLIRTYGIRNRILKDKGMTYQEFLKSDTWRKVKDKVRNAENQEYWGKCWSCNTDKNIDLHHAKYTQIDRVSLHQIFPLCRKCHELTHKLCLENDKLSIKSAMKKVRRKKLYLIDTDFR